MIGNRDLKRLERIIELKNELYDCIERNKITRESILDSQDIRWMVSMPLLDITEQVTSFSDEFLSKYMIPEYKVIKGMRNRLVHGYGDVDYDYIADAIFEDLPELTKKCEEIIKEGKYNNRP